MLIGFDASRAFVEEPTGTENYFRRDSFSISFLKTTNTKTAKIITSAKAAPPLLINSLI